MAICRVYLFTYKRNHLLPRAIKSLIDQDFKEWICEVHNNCPEDLFPSNFVASLNDDRFIIDTHSTNIGATAAFNLAFLNCNEKYGSILEDDNWWAPNFLTEMIALMECKPDIDVAWSNMKKWQEQDDNIWTDTGETIWPTENDILFDWPQPEQAMGALHSNGAMVYRITNATKYIIPNETLSGSVELVRERAFKHPIYMHSKVLAYFAITTYTNRTGDAWKWTASQIMQLSSFIMPINNKAERFKQTLIYYRKKNQGSVVTFFLANFFYIKDRSLFKCFNLHDWYRIIRWLIKNIFVIFELKKYLDSQNRVYKFLLTNTEQRFKDNATK